MATLILSHLFSIRRRFLRLFLFQFQSLRRQGTSSLLCRLSLQFRLSLQSYLSDNSGFLTVVEPSPCNLRLGAWLLIWHFTVLSTAIFQRLFLSLYHPACFFWVSHHDVYRFRFRFGLAGFSLFQQFESFISATWLTA